MIGPFGSRLRSAVGGGPKQFFGHAGFHKAIAINY